MNAHRIVFSIVAALALVATGCAKKQTIKPTPAPAPQPVAQAEPPAPAPAPAEAPPAAEPRAIAPIHFDFDKSIIHVEDFPILQALADRLLSSPGASVEIAGHCDERGTVEYNIALGDRRAAAARAYLIRLGVEPSRIKTISYGEADPVDPGHNEEAWAKNRRDEFDVAKK